MKDWFEALIFGYNKIGILTDKLKHTPFTIAQRMKDYGYTNYTMTIGELLGNAEKEKFSTYSINEIVSNSENITFQYPNNIILQII